MLKKSLIVALLSIVGLNQAFASILLDRTRAIYQGNKESMVLNIENTNKTLPYLAQAWLEDDKGKKIEEGPLVVLPPIQHVAPGSKAVIQITKTGYADTLPQDRESVMYFNLREIPPASQKENVLQISLQTNIKLFYRPAGILAESQTDYQNKLILTETKNGYVIKNPTPFHITVIGMGKSEKDAIDTKFDVVMIKPFSEQSVVTAKYKNPYLTFVNDFGGRTSVVFNCDNPSSCVVKK